MSKVIVGGICFILGGGIGFGAGWIFGAKRYEKILNDELDAMEEYYAVKYPNVPKRERTIDIKPREERVTLSKDVAYVKPEKIDYTKFYQRQEEDPAESESPKEEDNSIPVDDLERAGYAMTREYQENRSRLPKLIKGSEFGNTPGFDTMTLHYYTENEVLTVFESENAEDQIYFDEVEDWIGDALVKFGFDKNDEPRIWVRNFKRGCDYEVIKVHGAFGDD